MMAPEADDVPPPGGELSPALRWALAALAVRKEEVKNMEKKEELKAAKKAVRDAVLLQSCGAALGRDSREALAQSFTEACRRH
jgi:hypothetical protein